MKLRTIVVALAALILLACGGGGGGGGGQTATITGRVLSVVTGAVTNPRSTVRVGSSTITVETDGSFEIAAPQGTTSVVVDTLSAWGTFTFTFPAATGTTNVGDLWVGPQKVTLKGKVISSATDLPIEGAAVSFAGRHGETGQNGTFTLANVAYNAASQTVFWGIAGDVKALNFFSTQFSAQPHVAVAGVVTVDDIRMTPADDINPPPTPFNIWGRVSPTASAPGAIATLKENGTPVRIYNVGTDAFYRFWVPPGNYTIEVVKGTLSGSATANLTTPNEKIRRDVTLN